MKESEFIDLLNLYLDHEITTEDAARLEAEVQSNPARRRVYREYCQMQKACKLLAADFQTEAAAITDRKVVPFDQAARPRRSGNLYLVGAFAAAAACVAIIFVGQRREAANAVTGPATAQTVASQAPETRTATPAVVSAPVAEPARMIATTVSTASLHNDATRNVASLSLASNAQADAFLTTAMQQTDAQFEWMRNVQLTPLPERLPIEQIRFDTQPASVRTTNRTYGSPRPLQSDVRWIGFQFQR
jgi:anti-sigma factor RsiW